MQRKHIILGVHITDRLEHAGSVQAVLTEFGTCIKTRLGLHEVEATATSPNGLLVIEFVGADAKCSSMVRKLGKIVGVEVQKMVFRHP